MTTLWPPAAELVACSEHQREQYAMATAAPVGILGGGPGVGKTHCIAQVVKSLCAGFGVQYIAVCAPTGKAAQRMNELLLEYGITSIRATTIHRLLQVQRAGYDLHGWEFRYGSSEALPHRFIIVDEASMLGTNLLAALLAATRPGTHLLFVGDFEQLAPVEHGAPLRDMIAAGLPYGLLTEPRRSLDGGDIVRNCKDVCRGRLYRPSPRADTPSGHNMIHVEAEQVTDAIEAVKRFISSSPEHVDPMWDVQPIVATNALREQLNTILQPVLNPQGKGREGAKFKQGDKVICNSNGFRPVVACPDCNYGDECAEWTGKVYHCTQCQAVWSIKQMPEDFCANGEIGRVTYLHDKLMHVTFDCPPRTLLIQHNDIQDFDYAYAITGHKSQGAQWPYVLVVCDSSHGAYRVTSYEWHRTAWSRAQKLCVTIGKLSTIHQQCKRSALKGRKTFLAELLKEELEP